MSAQTVQPKTKSVETKEQKLERLKLLEARKDLINGLPHLYGFKLYKWQREFIESTEKINLLCAGNQLGKSIVNILKMVRWATDKRLWPKLWKNRPVQFWYLLPTKDLVTTEFRTKWLTEVLPRGEYKNHAVYGWREEFRNKHLWAIHFNSGVSIYFHTYEQDVHHLQGATVDAIFVDEEVPWDLMPELLLRINARNGYFCAVMTPTRGDDHWRRAFEVRDQSEVFPEAFKLQVSMFDCRYFEDGTPSAWTEERINQTINRLGTQAEIDLRVHGKFTLADGLKVPAFRRDSNLRAPLEDVPKDWLWYSGVDLGGGGGGSLPAIVFIAVNPTFTFGRVTEVWRGSPEQLYTDLDVLDQYINMRAQRPMAGEYYDFGAKDFGTFAMRAGVAMMPAEKSHEIGFPRMNALFKNQMLIIDDTEDNQCLVLELVTLREGQNKKTAMDHATDALRYGIVKIPWSLDGISGEKVIPEVRRELTDMDRRMGRSEPKGSIDGWTVDEQIDEWNDLLDTSWA